MTNKLLGFMRTPVRISFLITLLSTGVLSTGLLADTIVDTAVTSLGTQGGLDAFRYTYTISSDQLTSGIELDINFDPTIFAAISNGVAPADFSLLLFQPNSPPGTPGVYSLLSLMDQPSLAGPFSVDFTLLPGITLPATQPFVLFNDNPNGGTDPIGSGSTTPAVSGVPEPDSGRLFGAGVLFIAVSWALRRLRSRAA